MQFILQNQSGLSERDFMRKLNYQNHRDPRTGKYSYIRRAKPGGPFYPRYHAHVHLGEGEVSIDLHYDWRRPLHVKEARSADSSGDVVEREVARMQQAAAELVANNKAGQEEASKPKKKGIFGGLFGGNKTLK